MADLTGIGSIIGGVGNFASGIANTVVGSQYSKKNYELARDMANYQKELNRTIMEREDNAVQRRSADIKAAGGNPALAYMNGISGSGAGGSVSAPTAPKYDISAIQQGISQIGSGFSSISQIEANVLSNKYRKAEIERVDADISKTKAETLTELYRRLNIIENTSKTKAEREKIEASKEELLYNLDWYISKDLPTNANMPSILNYAHGFMEDMTNSGIDFKDKAQIVGEVLGSLAIGVFGAGILGKGASKVVKFIMSSPAKVNRAYHYLKRHGMPNKDNAKDFFDFVMNGYAKTEKTYKVREPIQFGVKGYNK